MRPPLRLFRALPLLVGLLAAACGPVPASPSGGSGPGSGAASPAISPGTTVPSATRPGSTIPPLDTGPDALALEPFATGLNEPIGITDAGDGSGDL